MAKIVNKTNNRKSLLKKSVFWLANFIAFGVLGTSAYLAYMNSKLPNVNVLTNIKLRQPLNVYDNEGTLLASYGDERRIPINYNEIPRFLRQSLDRAQNLGFNRFDNDFFIGSTDSKLELSKILAVNYFYNQIIDKKAWSTKVINTLLAHKINLQLSPQEVVTLFINQVPMGNKAFGFESAAITYFAKSLNKCSLSEIATLIAVSEDPELYDPTANFKTVMARRDSILKELLEAQIIRKSAYEEALAENIVLKAGYPDSAYTYTTEVVRQAMFERFGSEAFLNGYKVYTTVNNKAQLMAEMGLRTAMLEQSWQESYPGPQVLDTRDSKLKLEVSEENIFASLSRFAAYPPLFPVAITKISEDKVTVINNLGTKLDLNKKFFSWALNPSQANDDWKSLSSVYKVGDVIYLAIKKDSSNYNAAVDLLDTSNENKFDGLKLKPQELALATIPKYKAGLVDLDSQNGAIRALVGGFAFGLDKTNYAIQPVVTVGSVAKPFFYALDFRGKQTLATLELDGELPIKSNNKADVDWIATNFDGKYYNTVNLRQAFALNLNTPIIRQAQRNRLVEGFANYLQQFAFQIPDESVNTRLSLGEFKASPLEVARAYAVIDNGGYLINPYLIEKIERQDELLYRANNPKVCSMCKLTNVFDQVSDQEKYEKRNAVGNLTEVHEAFNSSIYTIKQTNVNERVNAPRVMDDWNAFLIYNVLTTSNVYGVKNAPGNNSKRLMPGNAAKLASIGVKRSDVGGMTGYNLDKSAVWFAGFTGNSSGAAFITLDNSINKLNQDASINAWLYYHKDGIKDEQIIYTTPRDITRVSINQDNSLLDNSSASAYLEWFWKGTAPTEKAFSSVTKTTTTVKYITTTVSTKQTVGTKTQTTTPEPKQEGKNRYKKDGSYNDDEFNFYGD